jgi:hypothetical protein
MAAMSEIRLNKAGITFRLFASRAAAIRAANSLTRMSDFQYNAKAVKNTGGFVAVSADGKSMYDSAGSLPQRALDLFKNCGAYLEWQDEERLLKK